MNLQQELESFEEINIKFLEDYDEDIRESFRLYNNAVNYVKNNSEDIALICLKKSAALNNSFSEALNLMALLYIKIKDYNAASNCIKKVIKIDKESARAKKYLQFIKEAKGEVSKDVESSNKHIRNNKSEMVDSSLKSKNKSKTNHDNNSSKNKKKKTNTKRKRELFRIVSISFLGVAIILIIFIVVGLFNNNSRNNALTSGNNKKKTSANNEYVLNKGQSLEQADISTKNKKAKSKKAKKHKTTSKPLKSPLPKPSMSPLPTPLISPLPTPLPNVNGAAAAAGNPAVNRVKGEAAYRAGNYKGAVTYLESYIKNGNKDQNTKLDMYYLLKSYYRIGNKAKAKEIYNTLTQQYPGSQPVNWARSWINR